jgi:hypothetical protein
MDSPVNIDWSTNKPLHSSTLMPAGTMSPALRWTMSPGATWDRGTSAFWPSRTTAAVVETRLDSSSEAFSARFS